MRRDRRNITTPCMIAPSIHRPPLGLPGEPRLAQGGQKEPVAVRFAVPSASRLLRRLLPAFAGRSNEGDDSDGGKDAKEEEKSDDRVPGLHVAVRKYSSAVPHEIGHRTAGRYRHAGWGRRGAS